MAVIGSVWASILTTFVPSDQWCEDRVHMFPEATPDPSAESADMLRETHADASDYTTWTGFDYIDA